VTDFHGITEEEIFMLAKRHASQQTAIEK